MQTLFLVLTTVASVVKQCWMNKQLMLFLNGYRNGQYIDELKAYQSKDPDIKEIINWIQTNTLPKTFPREVSQKLTLWCQRQQLQI